MCQNSQAVMSWSGKSGLCRGPGHTAGGRVVGLTTKEDEEEEESQNMCEGIYCER